MLRRTSAFFITDEGKAYSSINGEPRINTELTRWYQQLQVSTTQNNNSTVQNNNSTSHISEQVEKS